MTLTHAATLLGAVALVAVMAGCASKPQISAQQETRNYLSRARGGYTPPGPPSDPWRPYIREAAERYDVPEKWIREVMRQESGGNLYNRSGELITSGAGAMGLMQVMPQTYDDLRSRYRELGDDPYDPHNNILAGAAYLREMYDIFGSPGFLAAYNAGPGRLDDYLTRSRTLPTETRRYVAAIEPRIAGYEPRNASPGAQYAMNSVPLDILGGPRVQQFAATVPTPSMPAARPIVLQPQPVEVAEAAIEPPAAPSPVVVAQAQPTQPYITLNPPQSVVLADAEPVAQPIQLTPPQQRDLEPRDLDEEPVRNVLSRARQAVAAAEPPIPEPPQPPPAPPRASSQFARHVGSGRPVEVAEFAEPRFRSQRAAASAALVAAAPPHSHGFSLISSASAAPMAHVLPTLSAKGGAWAVQVGAYSSETMAHSATQAARGRAREVLGQASSSVAGVRQGNATLYRARLGGLSREAASAACEQLTRARTGCMVVPPER